MIPSVAYVLFAPDGLGVAANATSNTPWLNAIKFNPVLRLPEFLLGIVLARLFIERRVPIEMPRAARGVAMLGVAGVLVVVLSSASLPYVFLHSGLVDPLLAVVILLAAAEGTPFTGWLGSPVMRLLGDASYALYLLHVPIWQYAYKALEMLGLGRFWDHPVVFMSIAALAIGASIVSLQVIERPARAWLHSLWQSRTVLTKRT